MNPIIQKEVEEVKEELYQTFHNMSPSSHQRTEKYHKIANKIDALLTSHSTELLSKIEGMKKPKYDWSKDEHGKKCVDGCTYCCYAEGQDIGFNSALDQVISLINQEK